MIGARIQNYLVTSLLGQGGMGAVYVGQHPIIGRKVAIKVLQPEMAKDKSLVDRFINEARAANVIGHPNIVDILDVGTLPDGVPYIIMELLEGESLGQRLDRVGRIEVGQALPMAVQAMSALAAAHANGIVHRDLKPDNLFVVAPTRATAAGREIIKVLDFGIAKMKRELTNSPLTSTGALMGTPVYMSPEQCRGVPGEVDHRTDIYSMGIILYQMLCGRPPFTGEGLGDILVMHLTRAPQPLRALNPDLPASVERAVLAALEKDKDKRPPTMEAFQELLLSGSQREKSLAPTMLAADRSTLAPPASATEPPPPATRATPVREPTTFRASTGEVYQEDDAGARTGRKRTMIIGGGAGALGLVAVVVMVLARGGGGASQPGAPAAAAPAPVAVAAPPPPAPAVAAAPLPAESPPAAAVPAVAAPAPVASDESPPSQGKHPGRVNRASKPRKTAQRPAAAPNRSANAAAPKTSPLPPPPAPAAAAAETTPPPRKTKKW